MAKSSLNVGDVSTDDFRKIQPGQMKVIDVSTSESPGKSLKESGLVEVIITLDVGDPQ